VGLVLGQPLQIRLSHRAPGGGKGQKLTLLQAHLRRGVRAGLRKQLALQDQVGIAMARQSAVEMLQHAVEPLAKVALVDLGF